MNCEPPYATILIHTRPWNFYVAHKMRQAPQVTRNSATSRSVSY